MAPERGLLIINADDWGYNELTTRSIADCHQAGGVTSTTAMMFMAGSEEAASLADEHPRLGIGLHFNLFEEYSGESVSKVVCDRQRHLLDRFQRSRLHRWVYDPRIRRQVDQVVADQWERFGELYGRPPTHVDGHHHSHMAVNVLLSRSLPRGIAIRNALSNGRRPNPVTGVLQAGRRRLVLNRFRSTDYFFSIETVWPGLTGAPPDEMLGLSRHRSVEVMVHPAFPHEYGPLQSPAWVETLRGLPTGTFAGLR